MGLCSGNALGLFSGDM